MKVLAIVGLMIAALWCIENFVPGLLVVGGLIIWIAGSKKTNDGIDAFCVLGIAIGLVAGVVSLI